ncbi:Crp/Fnr family transcriptional regulator [Dysgonomonas sp. 216]|uniref:Crp/Fnr family transcriptional regulator n=1 Tax=Dysgonomonas sp. 216 TaxID=2302934 RepID=UPI0013CFD1C4|nr:Crp/Fnr family transcriptional regulator [Dysgonomonas sp. 216]NDW17555.1 Crp/Fnr family transcriptional regulator [Dysgonomonas sp. 216]
MAKEKNTKDVGSIASSIPEIWSLLSEEDREELASEARVMEFKKNEVIYCEGEVPKDMMCLIEGKVKIYKSGVGGRSQIVRMVRPVQNFGYRAFFAREPYVTAASAFEYSVICFIPMDLVEKFVLTNPRLAMFFIRELSTDLGIADERVVNLTQKHIRGRLAESLIFLVDNYGLEEDGATISIYLSREDLASLSNMTTSNAIRTLSTFVDEHIIALDGRKIKIIDEDKLRKVSKIG